MIQGALVDLIAYERAVRNKFYIPNSPAQISRNPGLLKASYRQRSTLNEFGVLQFPTAEAGMKAFKCFIEFSIYHKRTFHQVLSVKLHYQKIASVLEDKGYRISPNLVIKEFLDNVQLYRTSTKLPERL